MEIIDRRWAHWLTNVQSCNCPFSEALQGCHRDGWALEDTWMRDPQLYTFCSSGSDCAERGWRFPFCWSSNKAHNWVPAVLSWKEEDYVVLLSQKSWVLSLFTSIYIENWRMCYSAFQVWMFISEGLLQAFDNLCELLKLCICLNSIILVSIHHWFPNTEPLD